jgi:hypothetical protein
MALPLRVSLVSLSVLVATTGAGSGPVFAAAAPAAASGAPRLTSPDFAAGGPIPTRFTCKGAGDRPTLKWSGVPAAANSIAIVVIDPDAVHGPFTHWMVYGIPAARSGTISGGDLPTGAHEQTNSAGKVGWKGPCPPDGTGIHHYHFTLYADRGPVAGGTPADTEVQIRKQAVARATLTGTVAAAQQ